MKDLSTRSHLNRRSSLCGMCMAFLLFTMYTVQAQTSHTYYWTGASPLQPFFDTGENWLDINDQPNSPLQALPLNLIFGKAGTYLHSYTPEVNNTDYRIRSLLISSEAEQEYTITGDPLFILSSSGGNSLITNASAYRLTIESAMDYLRSSALNVPQNGNVILDFNTGDAGIRWLGGSYRSGGFTGTVTVNKSGFGTLELAGTHDYTFQLNVNEGELLIDTTQPLDASPITFNLAGAQFRVLGDENASSAQILELGTIWFGQYSGYIPRRTNRVIVDPVSEDYGLTLSFATWGGASGQASNNESNTIHFDLSRAGSAVHIQNPLTSYSVLNDVISFAVVTDSNGKTGFVQLVGNNDDGRNVTRYTGYTLLGTSVANNGTGWSNATHYYVNGNHTLTGTGEYRGLVGQWNTNIRIGQTLTLQGTGTLSLIDYHLRAASILMEDGTGDYTISGLGLATRGGNWSANELRLFQYRTDGRLIIDTDYLGVMTNMPASGTPTAAEGATNPADIPYNITGNSILTKAGPGTVVLKTNTSNMIGGTYVQEGRLQVEGNALNVTALVNVYDGALGGSGQIGGGVNWTWNGSANVASGIRYTPVTIARGGTIDVTPSDDNASSLLRGLSITGSLTMEAGSTMTMDLNSNVVAGSYIPLLVFAEDTEDMVVLLDGDLSLTLSAHLSSIHWITLLTTDGLISGTFDSINGGAFGEDNHFILTYSGVDYDFYLHYDYDLGGGFSGVVLQAIPEPTTITLLVGLALAGLTYARRRVRS